MDKRESKVLQVSSLKDNLVKLNIGGVDKKIVNRDILLKIPNSLLAETFSGLHDLKELDGGVYLDRDPDSFELMLNVLRTDFKFWP